ncbi:hypothetical protein BH23GEM3_BH23GEM3_03980 [soil metagenome]|nr:hypothetical protein [Gemmatimonadota bacterium]
MTRSCPRRSPPGPWRRSWSALLLAPLLAGLLVSCADKPTEPINPADTPSAHGDGHHSHGRYSHITWVPRPDIGSFAVEFTYQAAFRRGYSTCYTWTGSSFATTPCTGPNGRAGTGDIILETIAPLGSPLRFGDGQETGRLHFLVTSMNPSPVAAQDWIFVVALDPNTGTPNIIHSYSTNGPFVANNYDCCRISGLRNVGDTYGVQTIVTPGTGNRSPVSNLPPIRNVVRGGVQTWGVPANDADGDPLRWSLTSVAATGLFGAQPALMSIDPGTGVVSWNTDGRDLGLYWSNITIEELNPDGSVKGFVGVDYLINLVETTPGNTPPLFTSPTFCSGSVSTTVNQPLSFTVAASDPDAGDVVTLVGSGIPAGATFSPGPAANPASTQFSWTPPTTGPRLVTFTATDPAGAQTLCPITIQVREPDPDPDTLTVNVRINPATINLATKRDEGLLLVSILSTGDFDAGSVNAAGLTLGDGQGNDLPISTDANGRTLSMMRDVNGDGRPDLVVGFCVCALVDADALGLATTELVLLGSLRDGKRIRGTATVRVIDEAPVPGSTAALVPMRMNDFWKLR